MDRRDSPLRRLRDGIAGLGIPVDMLLATLIAVGWLVTVAVVTGNPWDLLHGLPVMLIPLGLIWFRDFLGDLVIGSGFRVIDAETPGWLVGLFGWVAMIAIIVSMYGEVFP